MMELLEGNHMGNILFSTNGDGKWFRTEWQPQCPKEVFMGSKCQGVEGHEGDHWCYGPQGDYMFDCDREDLDDYDVAAGQIPAGHHEYKKPEDMRKHYHMSHYSYDEVTDKEKIAQLERGEMNDGESITRPCDLETVKELKLDEAVKKIHENDNPT